MKVLSLFDGISCGRVALDRVGISVEKYVAYEIDESAIKISNKNYPDIEHCGDVTHADFTQYSGFDLLIGGSPCQGLSSVNVWLKDGEYGVNGTGTSSLFWHYVRALKTIKPKYFLFENVASMAKADREIVTKELGVEPILINSVLFSAQIRRRLYWTNIPVIIPTERQVSTVLADVLETTVPDKNYVCVGSLPYITNRSNKKWQVGNVSFNPKFAHPVIASCWKLHRADTDTYIQTVYNPVGRSNVRRLVPIEEERLQTLPDNYTECTGVSEKDRHKSIGNGWTVEVIAHIMKGMLTGRTAPRRANLEDIWNADK